jgi:hypothetical protein
LKYQICSTGNLKWGLAETGNAKTRQLKTRKIKLTYSKSNEIEKK